MKKVRLKKGRVIFAMAAIVFCMAITDSLRREFFKVNTNKSVIVEGSFISRSAAGLSAEATSPFTLDGSGQATTAFEGVSFIGFADSELTSDKVSQGLLVLANDEHPVEAADVSAMVDLSDCKNEYYSLIDEGVMLNKDAADALNNMMADYYAATDLSDFIVYGTTETFTGSGSYCPKYFRERETGNTVDLALNGCYSVIEFDGYDEEGWVVQNCAKYGFIVRYPEGKESVTGENFCPWHLRYVGKLHASIMESSNLCLEEYLDFLKSYTFEEPYKYTYEGASYEIYYIASEADKTTVKLPIAGNYSVSGNNVDGFIVTAKKI